MRVKRMVVMTIGGALLCMALALEGSTARAQGPSASALVGAGDLQGSDAALDRALIGIAVPSQEAVLASVIPARIASIPFAEGDRVEAGDVVVILEDEVQRAKTAFAQAAAEETAVVELARVNYEDAQREWSRLSRLHGERHATSEELEDARTALEVTRLELAQATFNLGQARRAYAREEALLEEYRLRAPFAGYVALHLKHAGEVVDQLEGIVRIVRLDPLEVRVDCPLGVEPAPVRGRRAVVTPVRSSEEGWSARLGTVTFVSRVADAASQTRRVRVAVPNGDGAWPGGLKVRVDFSAEAVAAFASAEHGAGGGGGARVDDGINGETER